MTTGPHSITLDCVVENLRYDLGSDKYGSILVTRGGGVPVNKSEDANPEREGDPITWVSPLNDLTELKGNSNRYGKADIPTCYNPLVLSLPLATVQTRLCRRVGFHCDMYNVSVVRIRYMANHGSTITKTFPYIIYSVG